jgi:hypothetical protein
MTWQPLWTTAGGVSTYFKANADGTFTVWSTQENDPFLEANKTLQNQDDGWSPNRDFRREGSIPLNLIEKWKREQNVNVLHPSGHEFLKRKLNDSTYRHLRTSPGKT